MYKANNMLTTNGLDVIFEYNAYAIPEFIEISINNKMIIGQEI